MPIRKQDDQLVAIHPGEFLREDYMAPIRLSSTALALALRVPVTRISEIVNERRGITAETALRLGRYFGTSGEFWINMQKAYELAVAKKLCLSEIEREVQRRVA